MDLEIVKSVSTDLFTWKLSLDGLKVSEVANVTCANGKQHHLAYSSGSDSSPSDSQYRAITASHHTFISSNQRSVSKMTEQAVKRQRYDYRHSRFDHL